MPQIFDFHMFMIYIPTTFQLYRSGQFYWWRKPDYPEKTTNLLHLVT